MKEIVKTRAKIKEIETRKKEKINKTESWFFDKIDKTLARLTKKKTQITKIENESGTLTILNVYEPKNRVSNKMRQKLKTARINNLFL